MSKYFALWNGGTGYSPADPQNDTEVFPSITAAKLELDARRGGWAEITRPDGAKETTRTPCVEDDSEFILWTGGDGRESPDCGIRIFHGPRGGVRQENF